MKQLQCPHCGSNNVTKTTTGKVTTGAKNTGIVALTIGGKMIDDYTGIPFVGKGVAAAGKWALSFTPIEFVCNSCDSLFNSVFNSDGEVQDIKLKKTPMPIEIIENVRAEYIQTIRKKRPIISAIIYSLFTLYCLIYLVMGIAEEFYGRIIVSFLFLIPFGIVAIFKFVKISQLNNQITECESQSPLDFKHLHRDLFYQYSQYN